MRIRVGAHRFHRDLPETRIWGYGGTVPGPTIETERGRPVVVTIAPANANKVPLPA